MCLLGGKCPKKTLTHYSSLIQPSFIRSKWNMGEILMTKSGLEKNIYEIPPCEKPLSENLLYFIERWIFAQNYKFSDKNDPPFGISKKKLWLM
jgi:hypothetical protein